MKKNEKKSRRFKIRHPIVLARTFLALLFGIFMVWVASSWYEKRLVDEQRTKYRDELLPYAEGLSTLLNERLSMLDSMDAFVKASMRDADLRSRFEIFASGLYAGYSGIRAIQLFPPVGPEIVFPRSGNEAVAGRGLSNLLNDERPNVRADIEKAISTGKAALSGPYELRQGGLGVIARKAVFDRGNLWGFVVLVLDLPPLLKQSGVVPPASSGLVIGLKDGTGKIVAGEPAVFEINPIRIDIDVEDQIWQIAGVPSGGWFESYSSHLRFFWGLGLASTIFFAGLVFSLSDQGARLREAVETKTTALRESEGQLKEAQRLGRIGNWNYSLETKEVRWSDEVYALYGRDPTLGPPSPEEEAAYYSPETAQRLRGLVNLAIAEGKNLAYDFEVTLRKGDKAFFSATMRAAKDDSGSFTNIIGTVQDITERKTAENKVRELNEALEKKVDERTAELLSANKELEAFTYSVSHDLRAPLRAINGFSRILEEDFGSVLDEEGRRLCNVISKNAQSMGLLIDELLSFSRLGRASLRLATIDMTQMAQSVYAEMSTSVERAAIDFSVGILPVAIADPTLIRQVWTNLLSNAVKFSAKKAKAMIRIEGVEGASENRYSVRDNGAGFDMKYADKLFGVFQRLHRPDEFEGTGVGLAIAKRIVTMHGGKIWAESVPEEGSIFYFTLPKGA